MRMAAGNALSEVAREKQRVRGVRRDGAHETELRHPEVLRLVDHDMRKRLVRPCRVVLGERLITRLRQS